MYLNVHFISQNINTKCPTCSNESFVKSFPKTTSKPLESYRPKNDDCLNFVSN